MLDYACMCGIKSVLSLYSFIFRQRLLEFYERRNIGVCKEGDVFTWVFEAESVCVCLLV